MLGPRKEGEVHVNAHGKQLVIAAGHVSHLQNLARVYTDKPSSQHAIVHQFGLEGTLVHISTSDFYGILSDCVKGNNPDPVKAEQMHVFHVPSQFFNNLAEDQNIACLAALVCPDFAWVLCDFVRLA